jgi:hypothetical protein
MTLIEHTPRFEKVASVRVAVAAPVDVGTDLLGQRRVVPIVGGEVSGGWSGTILPGGADWQIVLDDGSVLIAARYPVQLDGVGTVCFEVRGVRRPCDAAFCTTVGLTGLPDGELGASTYVTVGAKDGDVVAYDLYSVAATYEVDQASTSDGVLSTEYRCTIEVDLQPPIVATSTAFGSTQVIPIVGGRVLGPALSGEILPIGADWAVERAGGVLDVHAQYAIRTADGAVISVDNMGHWRERPSQPPYFMTAPTFVTGPGPHQWLTHGVFVAPAVERSLTRVELFVFEVTPASGAAGVDRRGSVAATSRYRTIGPPRATPNKELP